MDKQTGNEMEPPFVGFIRSRSILLVGRTENGMEIKMEPTTLFGIPLELL